MATVIIKDAIHIRLKRLAIDAGTTIGQLVHDGCEHILDRGEEAVEILKKQTKAGKATKAK